MQPIVKIVPVNEMFSITWAITDHCNYDCMYCPEQLHKPAGTHRSLVEFKAAWQSIIKKTAHQGLKYKLAITGGEPTSSKALLPFLQWVQQEYPDAIGQILINSNASAPTGYYKKLLGVVNNLTLTMHSEHIDELAFFDKIKELKLHIVDTDRVLHVDIMNEPWNAARIAYYETLLTKLKIPYSINLLDLGHSTRTFPIFKGSLNLDIS